MRKIALALAILGTTLVSALYTAPAHAQATRTWVSGVGDDANPCSRTAPCKTWAGAIAKTTAGGEIDNLDAGGFGALTITKSITLDGGGGAVASTLVSGTNGMNVAAGSTDVVIIKNIRFQGLLGNGSSPGSAGITGLSVSSAGQVVVDTCAFIGFNTSGISVAPSGSVVPVEVRNSTFLNNPTGISASGSGGGVGIVQVVNSTFVGTFKSGAPSGTGVSAGSNGAIAVSDSNFQDLSIGAQALAGATLDVDTSIFTTTTTAISAATGTSSPVNAANNSFYNAGTAFGGGGSYLSDGHNKIGSGTSGGATPASMPQQ
jgi:hypothetical protein